MENRINTDDKISEATQSEKLNDSVLSPLEEEHTPKLFSDDGNEPIQEEMGQELQTEENHSQNLFNQDNHDEEDFEIPAFLRRQKF